MSADFDPLTFDLLDDVAIGVCNGRLNERDIPPLVAGHLGPVVELLHLGKDFFGSTSFYESWLQYGDFASLIENLDCKSVWYQPGEAAQGFAAVAYLQQDLLAWNDFGMRAKRAAIAAGFLSDIGGKIVAAIGEFLSNVTEHSQKPVSGYLVFAARLGQFEFVVADRGIGVLSSLRSNPSYSSLTDAGHALELALSEGVSRFGDGTGRGLGFRPVFVGLANISSFMRFRSGDHGRVVSRSSDGSIVARTSQKAPLQGFLCSILCSSD